MAKRKYLKKASSVISKEFERRDSLVYKEELKDEVKFLSHSWRDQKTLTILGDNQILYVYSQRNNKLIPMYPNKLKI